MIKLKDKIKRWNIIFVAIVITSRIIEKRCFLWFNMYTTTFRMRLQISYFSKSFLKLKQIFNLIKTTKNVQMYLL